MQKLIRKLKAPKHEAAGVLNNVKKVVDHKLQQLAIYLSEKTSYIQPRTLAVLLFIACLTYSTTLILKTYYSFKTKRVAQLQMALLHECSKGIVEK